MSRVVCAVDESGSEEAVRAAIDFCLEQAADLRLVGIVADKLTDSTRAGGERVRRNKTVKLHLNLAAIAARKAGVQATITVRAGAMADEVMREATALRASDAFFLRKRGRLRAAVSRKPRAEFTHLALGLSIVGELSVAA